MKKYQRPLLHQNGDIDTILVRACECVGIAQKMYVDGRWMGWTVGRRGPAGGICGACGGAIRAEKKPAYGSQDYPL